MSDNREAADSTNNTIKLDQVRNVPGGALLRTMPGTQGRFMMASPVQSTAAVISTTTTIQTQQVLPKVSGQVGITGVNRISAVPIQAPTTTGYHVPRGAAAVANISAPRSSVATPIVRGSTTLQTISVGQQHGLSSSGTNSGRPVVGVTCLSGQSRPPPIPGARLVSSQMRPIGDVSGNSCRPVLVHAATHKQVTLTQQQVQMSGAVKSYSNTTRHPGTPSLSRITTLPPGMVQISPTATAAVFLPSQPIKTQSQQKVISQAPHATGVQMPSAASSVPQTLSISTVVNRPVVLGGSATVENSIRPVSKPNTATTPTDTSKLYIPGSRSTILIRDPPPRTKEPEPISITPNSTQPATTTTTTTGVNTLYTLPSAAYFDGGSVRPLVTLAQASRTTQATSTTSSQPMRLNPVMVVDQQQQPPRIHALVPPPSNTENSHGPLAACDSSCLPASTGGGPVPLPKQVTSPRPSILRKRDPDGLVTSSISLPKKPRSPMKGASKNLTPLMGTINSSNSPPTLPPSPPLKRPESSSGGSTTVSANSSPGESPSEPPQGVKEEEEPPQLRSLPPEVSPRKKPRKQQLTGNQITEPTFSEDDMEFITEDKLKKELKEEAEAKVIPKKKSMSLLSTYKNSWKPRNNHFMRYSDLRVKEEKVTSMNEIANQKHVLQNIDGWKIYHLRSQLEEMVKYEEKFTRFYDSLLCVLEINQQKNKNKELDKEYSRINEIVRANFQRTKVSKDQMLDAKSQMMKFFDHKPYIADLINKNMSKRSGNKKRDRAQ